VIFQFEHWPSSKYIAAGFSLVVGRFRIEIYPRGGFILKQSDGLVPPCYSTIFMLPRPRYEKLQ